ncbi:MAG TPA: cytochrome c [Bryobacteraceae bacterium]|nr:cytochrome c [Bryobacteraceae bacterium]
MLARIFLLIPAASLCAQNIWEGVYTAAQAGRGKAAFETSCINCHNRDLSGSVRGPALRGEKFMLDWRNGSVNNLFSKIRYSMPATYPETVSDEAKLDIVAYLLQQNGFPAGPAELEMKPDQLEAIQIVEKGRTGLPNFALVQVAGCLTKGPGGNWILTKATEPSAAKENAPAPAAAGGGQTFQLASAAGFQPHLHQGQTVAVKGLLYRDAGGNWLNVTDLQIVAPACFN